MNEVSVVKRTQELVDRINAILDRSQDRYIHDQVAKHEYEWQLGVDDATAVARLARNKHKLIAIEKHKYVNIDRIPAVTPAGGGAWVAGSGLFMVEKSTGRVYGIKGYGVVYRGHTYGTLDAPELGRMALKASVLERFHTMQELELTT